MKSVASGAIFENLPALILSEHDLWPKTHPLTHDYGQAEYSLFPGKQVLDASHHPQWGFATQ